MELERDFFNQQSKNTMIEISKIAVEEPMKMQGNTYVKSKGPLLQFEDQDNKNMDIEDSMQYTEQPNKSLQYVE